MHFAHPKSDTCALCDQIKMKISNSNDDEEKLQLEQQLLLHTVKSDAAYETLRNDIIMAQNNQNHVVISVDLQQVLQIPVLSNSKYFYQRKFSCYNFGMNFQADKETIFSFWHEVIGNRFADEMTSSILKKVIEKYPSQTSQLRRLRFCGISDATKNA